MPRRADPEVAVALTEAAARLLNEEGPSALTTRRLASEVGTSTTSVYTHFGSKEEMVRTMVAEGFDRLAKRSSRVKKTDDTVRDLMNLGWAYRRHAMANPHLFLIMFGRSVPEFQPTVSDRQQGIPALQILVDGVQRAIDSGRFAHADSWSGALGLWTAMHGVVCLELDGYLGDVPPFEAVPTLREVMVRLAVGMGDDLELAEASVAASRV
jgi:AcrR family transcriptional regulator